MSYKRARILPVSIFNNSGPHLDIIFIHLLRSCRPVEAAHLSQCNKKLRKLYTQLFPDYKSFMLLIFNMKNVKSDDKNCYPENLKESDFMKIMFWQFESAHFLKSTSNTAILSCYIASRFLRFNALRRPISDFNIGLLFKYVIPHLAEKSNEDSPNRFSYRTLIDKKNGSQQIKRKACAFEFDVLRTMDYKMSIRTVMDFVNLYYTVLKSPVNSQKAELYAKYSLFSMKLTLAPVYVTALAVVTLAIGCNLDFLEGYARVSREKVDKLVVELKRCKRIIESDELTYSLLRQHTSPY